MRFVFAALLIAAALLSAAAGDLLKEIGREAERQREVSRRLIGLAAKFEELIEDLESNELGDEKLAEAAAAIKSLGDERVPRAAAYLEEALRRPGNLGALLEKADAEIELILEEMAKLIEGIEAGDLIRELIRIIERERRVHGDTVRWGARVYASSDTGEEREALAERQDRVAQMAVEFQGRLAAAAQDSPDPIRRRKLKQGHDLMIRRDVVALLAGAADEIRDRKPVRAVEMQREALNALEELKKLLTERARIPPSIEEILRRVLELAEKQEELSKRTEGTPEGELSDLKSEQEALKAEVEELAALIPIPQLGEAAKQMGMALGALSLPRKDQAVRHQREAARLLRELAELLRKLLRILELISRQLQLMDETARIEGERLPELAPPQRDLAGLARELGFDEAAKYMEKAAEALEERNRSKALAYQRKALEVILRSCCPGSGASGGDLMPLLALCLGMGCRGGGWGAGLSLLINRLAPGLGLNELGYRFFPGRGAPTAPPPGGARWSPLSNEAIEASYRGYIERLPLEYREILERYYELLSE